MGICQIWFSQLRRVAREMSNNGDIQECDRTVEVEDKIHPRMLTLTVHNARESKYFLFSEYLGATV